jgi:HD superfamily phosphohydrolase YqeK
MVLHERVAAAADGVLPEWACVGPERLAHIERVAELMESWGRALQLDDRDRARWRAAAYLHDALRGADPDDLRVGLPEEYGALPGPVLHGPAAAERLRSEGVADESLLRSVAYHTVGHPDLDRMGRVLYAADFLEPGRPFLTEWRAELRARMPDDLDAVTREILAARIRHLVDCGVRLLAPTVAFWNAVLDKRTAGVA